MIEVATAPGSVLFVCSNDIHVLTFDSVARELEASGCATTFASLDPFYRQGVDRTAAILGRRVEPLLATGVETGDGDFYDRGVLAIWRDVIRSRRGLDFALAGFEPSAVVLGNDQGLIEKSVIDLAKRRGTPTVLVQDGRLGWGLPVSTNVKQRALGSLKKLVSPILERSGRPYLAASEYGEGGVQLALASGRAGAEILQRSPSTRVVTTGQPRYDRLIQLLDRAGEATPMLLMLTTPFAATRFGSAPQLAQERLAAEVSLVATAAGMHFVVKPHPRENADRYRELVGPDAVSTQDPAIMLSTADLALIGMSSLVEEAGLLRVPVLVPGRVLYNRTFEPFLPSATAYPRIEGAQDVGDWIERLKEQHARALLIGGQTAVINDEVFFDASRPASVRVATEIAALVPVERP